MIKNGTLDIREDAILTQLFCGTDCKDYYGKFLSDISISKIFRVLPNCLVITSTREIIYYGIPKHYTIFLVAIQV